MQGYIAFGNAKILSEAGLAPWAPPWRKYLETIYHSRRKGKV